ncbi:hypothetical protein GIB67_011431 [Kingdonia uniflora]|uniref:Uncharacterized protein n=1 Tax=Kingdonia uniflora TaxID=39325 RepID=A0A7J7NLN9_9MAGN|nr:hypothetical protein GIB67_011431 [Kingdonia uniflora]
MIFAEIDSDSIDAGSNKERSGIGKSSNPIRNLRINFKIKIPVFDSLIDAEKLDNLLDRKHDIRVEVEDSRYLIIITDNAVSITDEARSFMRKFRLTGMIDIGGISAGYEDGVVTVVVLRQQLLQISLEDLREQRLEIVAPAA